MELCPVALKAMDRVQQDPGRVVEPRMVEDDEHIEVMNVESPTPSCSSHIPRPLVKTKKKSKGPFGSQNLKDSDENWNLIPFHNVFGWKISGIQNLNSIP
ncbi:hypothetical protein Tco_0307271 [Tanacetum coccineum]